MKALLGSTARPALDRRAGAGIVHVGSAAPEEGVLPMSSDETKAYIRDLDANVASLKNDIESQTVWASPKEVYEQVHPKVTYDPKTGDLLGGTKMPGYGEDTGEEVDPETGYTWKWYTESDFKTLVKNAAGKTEERIASEIAFYQKKWRPFENDWKQTLQVELDPKWTEKLKAPGGAYALGLINPLMAPVWIVGTGIVALSRDIPLGTWNEIKELHKRFNALHDEFASMGGKPSREKMDVPSPSIFSDLGKPLGLGSTTTKIVTVAAVVGGAYVFFKYVVPVALPLVFPEATMASKLGKGGV